VELLYGNKIGVMQQVYYFKVINVETLNRYAIIKTLNIFSSFGFTESLNPNCMEQQFIIICQIISLFIVLSIFISNVANIKLKNIKPL